MPAEPGESSISPEPYTLLRTAASGDLQAIRSLARLAESIATAEGDIAATIEGLVFARMASLRGDKADTERLLGLLQLAETNVARDPEWNGYRDQLVGEAMAVASFLADAGNEEAELALLSLTRTAGREANLNALELRERLLGGGGDTLPSLGSLSDNAPAPPPGFFLDREAGGHNAPSGLLSPPGFTQAAPNVPIVPNVPGVA